jgi:hypothetical protein
VNTEKLKKIAMVAVPLLCLVVGAGLGWYLKPDVVRVEEKLKVVEVTKEVVVVQEQVRVEVVKVKDVQIVDRWHREKTEETRPDGTKLVKEVEDRNIDSVLKEKETATEVRVVEVEKQVVVDRIVDREVKIEPVLPKWHLGAMVGVAPRFDIPTETAIMAGISAEHRVAGPFWMGAYVMAGTPTYAFKPTAVNAGLKLGFEF